MCVYNNIVIYVCISYSKNYSHVKFVYKSYAKIDASHVCKISI